MRNIKSLIGASLLSTLIGKAEADSGEVMVSNDGTTLDLKASTELAPKVLLFTRHIPKVNHSDNTVDYYGFASVSYNVVGGLNANVNAQALTGVGSTFGIGPEYFTQFGNTTIYALVDVAFWNGEPTEELVLDIGYRPPITDKLNLVLTLEEFTQVNKDGHVFSQQKGRVAIGIDKFEFGPAVNIIQQGKAEDMQLGYEVGGSVKVQF